jgi:AcrR family transcriptional regulator
MARVDRTAYLECALDLLAEAGSEGLTVAALCRRLGVTKGSFYHHFSGMPELEAGVLDFWEQARSRRLIEASEAEPDPSVRAGRLVEIAAALPHDAEAALRSWGRSNPRVAAVVTRVDGDRERHLRESFELAGMRPELARVRARIAMAVLVGTQQRERPVDTASLREMMEQLHGESMRLLPGPHPEIEKPSAENIP